jgi:hypothetical protein
MEAVGYRHVKTDFDEGLLPGHVEIAVDYLSRPMRARRRRTRGYRLPPNVVTVTRPGAYGNPYTGELALDAFDVKAAGMKLGALRGKDLACWCPLSAECHADILLHHANL